MEFRRPKFGLRQRVISGVLIAVFAFLVTSIAGYRITEQRFTDYVAADLSTTAELEAARISSRIKSTQMLLEGIASNPMFIGATGWRFDQEDERLGWLGNRMAQALDGSPFVSLTFMGPEGVLATTIVDHPAELALMTAATAGATYGAVHGTDDGIGVMHIAAPVSAVAGPPGSYRLVAEYSLAEIQDLVATHADAGATHEAYLARLTADGDVELITPLRFQRDAAFDLVIPASRADQPIVQAVNGAETVLIGVDDYRQTPSIAALRRIDETGWGLVVKMDLEEARQPVDRLLDLLMLGIAVSAVVAVSLLWLLFRPIMRRMATIERAAQTVEAGNYSHRINDAANDELRAVSDAFDLAVATMEGSLDEKNRFVATVSHELRTPLTSVMGLADTLAREGDTFTDAELREFSEMIRVGASEIGTLVEDLLTAAQLREGTLLVEPEPTSLREIATTTVSQMPEEIRRKVTLAVDEDHIALADPVRTRQIMRNLLANAHRYGGRRVEVKTTSCLGRACIQVVDNGPGVPRELSDAIFTAYLSAHDRSGQTDSVGLGLSISRELARRMGGDLTYERAGRTTVFELHLPAAHPEAPAPGSGAGRTEEVVGGRNHIRVTPS